MSFAATWMNLDIIILKWSKSERERQIPYDIFYIWTLRYNTNEHFYELETDSQINKTSLWLPKRKSVVWD